MEMKSVKVVEWVKALIAVLPRVVSYAPNTNPFRDRKSRYESQLSQNQIISVLWVSLPVYRPNNNLARE